MENNNNNNNNNNNKWNKTGYFFIFEGEILEMKLPRTNSPSKETITWNENVTMTNYIVLWIRGKKKEIYKWGTSPYLKKKFCKRTYLYQLVNQENAREEKSGRREYIKMK